MGGHVAFPDAPLGGRLREAEAILACGKVNRFLTPFTLFNNRVANAAIELATFLTHKETIVTLFYACTNHFDHILSLKILTHNYVWLSSICQAKTTFTPAP